MLICRGSFKPAYIRIQAQILLIENASGYWLAFHRYIGLAPDADDARGRQEHLCCRLFKALKEDLGDGTFAETVIIGRKGMESWLGISVQVR